MVEDKGDDRHVSPNEALWQAIHGNYSHQAHCEHQVEIARDNLRGVGERIEMIKTQIRSLVVGYDDTIYRDIKLDQVDWDKLAMRYWDTYSKHTPEEMEEKRATSGDYISRGKLSGELQDVLKRCELQGLLLKLPPEQLSTALYGAFKKAMEGIGGKWNTSKKGFVFQHNPAAKIREALGSGEIAREKQRDQAFYTPSSLAEKLVSKAQIKNGHVVLEPSAGDGALLQWLMGKKVTVTAFEINPETTQRLQDRFPLEDLRCGDFLEVEPDQRFDRVIMNPPFTKNQDIDHVEHAFKFLKPGGKLVAIMFGNTTRPRFEKFVRKTNAQVDPIEAGAFKESGTSIATVMVTIDKPKI